MGLLLDTICGDPSTPTPYCRITPTKMNGVLLPFSCPKCKRPITEMSDPVMRELFHDTRENEIPTPAGGSIIVRNNNYWCPKCGLRFFMRADGRTLNAGTDVAPSLVEGFDNHATVIGALVQDAPAVPSKKISWWRDCYETGCRVLMAR